MSQRLEITEKGKILVHTDNGVFDGSKWGGEMSGEFTVDALDVGRLLASNADNLIETKRTYWQPWGKCTSNIIISKDDLFSAHKKEVEDKDTLNEHLKDRMYIFNTLPFWQKMFYKFDV